MLGSRISTCSSRLSGPSRQCLSHILPIPPFSRPPSFPWLVSWSLASVSFFFYLFAFVSSFPFFLLTFCLASSASTSASTALPRQHPFAITSSLVWPVSNLYMLVGIRTTPKMLISISSLFFFLSPSHSPCPRSFLQCLISACMKDTTCIVRLAVPTTLPSIYAIH